MANKTDKALHIQCRLHENVDYEGEAIAYFRARIQDGYTPRQIITDALLRAADFRPEMFPQDSGRVTFGKIENLLSDFAQEIIRSLRGSNLRSVDTSEAVFPEGQIESEDMEFAKNIASGFMARRNRKGTT